MELEILISIILLSSFFLVVGFWKKDYPISALAGISFFILGVSMLTKDGINDILLRQGFGIVLIGISSYIMLRGSYESIKYLKWKGVEGVKEAAKE